MSDPGAFYEADGDDLIATPATRGPWDDRHQHGGPPSALLAGAMDRVADDGALLARITIELLRPVPIGRVRVEVEAEAPGRRAQRVSARLWVDGRLVARASGVRLAPHPVALPPGPAVGDGWPEPEGLPSFDFPFFRHPVGYHRGVDLRLAGGTWGATPVRFWARPRLPLVAGRDGRPVEAVVLLADAQSGMGPPLDPERWAFPNPDLTVALARRPRSEWLGFEVVSIADRDGSGLSESRLSDREGPIGRSLQTLVIAPR